VPPKNEQEELRPELERAQEEIWRLRDLLIAKESELGILRGRLQELESGAAPLITIALRLRSLLPGSLRSLLSRLLRRKPS
jgi:predicted nuclease with TOPRIM domain